MPKTKPQVKKATPVIRYHDVRVRNENLPQWNLVCTEGHLHYSPEPMTWVGHECSIRFYNEKTGRRSTCHKKQMLLKDYKPARIPKPNLKKKKPRKRKIVPRY